MCIYTFIYIYAYTSVYIYRCPDIYLYRCIDLAVKKLNVLGLMFELMLGFYEALGALTTDAPICIHMVQI